MNEVKSIYAEDQKNLTAFEDELKTVSEKISAILKEYDYSLDVKFLGTVPTVQLSKNYS